MSARLGEMLLKVGALTEEQLEQVLNAQAIYGGRLGTNLVEMGLIGEDELAHALNEKLGVPCVDAAALNGIPKEVLGAVPTELVQRYRVLPVAREGRKLTLAMADPSDFKAVEEIGFGTGLVIVPRVCSELRLNMALEHYFGIRRAVRYIPVSGGTRSRFGKLGQEKSEGDPAAGGGCPGGIPARYLGADSVEELAEKFSGASKESEVVSVLLTYLGGEFDRGAFFTVKRNMLVGVSGVNGGIPIEGFSAFSVPVEESQRLKRVVQEKLLFMGELGAEGVEGHLQEALGGGQPNLPVVLVPISVGGQVAAIIGASDQKGRLSGGVFELQRIAAMAELTFEMVCIRKKIKTI